MSVAVLARRAAEFGLQTLGAFHPAPEDAVPAAAPGVPTRTLVLLGWTGRAGFDTFASSPEAADGGPHPLDRWSRRVIEALASEFGAAALYPFGGPPHHPFQRWAARGEPLSPSPLGLFIHPRYGLWHAFRGALAFPVHLDSEPEETAPSPCSSCETRPCLGACPVAAFDGAGYDVERCAAHLRSPAGAECRDRGCLARRACPVGADHAYGEAQAAFYMRAFIAARA